MANRVVVQPNGLYARFSDVVDHFTHYHHTREEMLELYSDLMGKDEATAKVERAEASPNRFDEEIRTIKILHGAEEAEKWSKILSESP